MSLVKHEIPILEYDNNPVAVLRPNRQNERIFPGRAVFAFLGELVDAYAEIANAEVLDTFETISGKIAIYRIHHKDETLCLCRAPLGGPAAVQLLDWLIGHGVRSIIATGSCGALASLPENAFLIPVKALRAEGASYHYLLPARFVDTSCRVREHLEVALINRNIPFHSCCTWTTDGFFRETEAMIQYRLAEGCEVVEMECASLAACAVFRGAEFAQLLYTADSLADPANYDERGWGKSAMETALLLCLDAAARL